ncbi:Arc family DNA-binding protein [Ursidibacter sp. B-7004-1]
MKKEKRYEEDVQANVRFTGEIAEKIKHLAESDDRSVAYVVKRLVKEALAHNG